MKTILNGSFGAKCFGGLLPLFALCLFFGACAIPMPSGRQAGEMALAAGNATGFTTSTSKDIDTDGDGVLDTRETTIGAGPVVENAAKAIPYGEIALGTILSIASALGFLKYRTKLLDTPTEEG